MHYNESASKRQFIVTFRNDDNMCKLVKVCNDDNMCKLVKGRCCSELLLIGETSTKTCSLACWTHTDIHQWCGVTEWCGA